MARKPAPKADDPEQAKRFTAMARELAADEDPKAFDRAFLKIAGKKTPRPSNRNSD